MRIALSLRKLGLTSDVLHGLGFGSMLAAISLWVVQRQWAIGGKRHARKGSQSSLGFGRRRFSCLGKSCKTLKPLPLSKFCGHEALKSRSSTKHSATRPQRYQRPDVGLDQRRRRTDPRF